jgi:uncharacterized membrane protein YdbT with pleckstrin-like domain
MTEFHQSKTRLGIMIGFEALVILFLLFTPAGRYLSLVFVIMIIVQLTSYFAVRVRLEKQHIVLTTGIVSKQTADIPYEKINSVTVKQGIFGRIFGFGNLVVFTGNDTSGIKVIGIDKPNEIKQAVKAMVAR